MLKIKELQISEYERVVEAVDDEVGLHAFIAVHNTTLGPALGGVRIYPYQSREEALEDVLRLAKGMTYKSALTKVGFGGGKSSIIADLHADKKEILEAFAEVINLFEGKYIAAEDMGTTIADMETLRNKTPYVCALKTERSSGDPSRYTAWGIFQGMMSVAHGLWGELTVRKRKIAIQGLGNVGDKLANVLFWAGADLILTDIDKEKLHRCEVLYHAKIVEPHEIYQTPCDIFCPCAMGNVINEETIDLFYCKAIAGSANNQLKNGEYGEKLMHKGILYAPDYLINSGGLINAAMEFVPGGYNPKTSLDKVNQIRDILHEIIRRCFLTSLPTNVIANNMAEQNLKLGVGKREEPIEFNR